MKGLLCVGAGIRTQVPLAARPLCLKFFSWKQDSLGIYFSFQGFALNPLYPA